MGRAEAAERDLGFLLPATGSPRKVDKPVSWVLFPSVGLICEHRRGGSHGGGRGGWVERGQVYQGRSLWGRVRGVEGELDGSRCGAQDTPPRGSQQTREERPSSTEAEVKRGLDPSIFSALGWASLGSAQPTQHAMGAMVNMVQKGWTKEKHRGKTGLVS